MMNGGLLLAVGAPTEEGLGIGSQAEILHVDDASVGSDLAIGIERLLESWCRALRFYTKLK